MASLQYSRAIASGVNATLLAYRNSAAGAYDVSYGPVPAGGGLSIANYGLAHVWHGVTAALTWTSSELSIAAGATATDYHRDHSLAMRPMLTVREYTNTGVKREEAGFAKVTWDRGPLRFGADLNLRHTGFRYRPSSSAGVAPQLIGWTFANPRAGITWTVSPSVSVYATAGRTSREPARGDLFAGADDLNAGNAAGLLPLDRVRPEQVDDLEGGATWRNARGSVAVNLFDMEFRDEIAAIGALSLTGSPLRKNVPRSYRRGVELDGTYQFARMGTLIANLALMHARIAVYADDASGALYHNVEPVMSPPVIGNLRWELPTFGPWGVALAARHVDRAHLANDGNAALVTPAHSTLNVALRWARDGREVRAELNNALDADAYAGGYTDGSTRYLYPIASRNVLVTVRLPIGR
jgi:iron complex outermembrane receptor protein